MLFNSYIFILAFLPLCLLGYFTINHFKQYRLAQLFLLGMSLLFYGYYNPWYLIIILFSILVNFGACQLMEGSNNVAVSKLVCIVAVCINIGILMYFKYMDFFIDSINVLFKKDIPLLNIALPLGISFFTFQQISFVVDAMKGQAKGYNFLEYACFVTYFPQLVAGPIVTHDELIPQFEDEKKKHVDYENLAKGIYIFCIGLGKKVLIADIFGNAVNSGYLWLEELDAGNTMLIMLFYTLQIYFDFSGYCDMAMGMARMMNIELPLNFNAPYKSLSIQEFWDRWHMTLTRFFTKYVYIPLGGNRKGKFRTYINILIVFFLSGFWHGAGVAFILWGVGHGILSILNRIFKNAYEKLPKAIRWFMTFLAVNLLWVLFRAESIRTALRAYRNMLSLRFGPIRPELTEAFQITGVYDIFEKVEPLANLPWLFMVIFIVVAMLMILCTKTAYEKMLSLKPSVWNLLAVIIILVWSVFSLTGMSTFLYFNF